MEEWITSSVPFRASRMVTSSCAPADFPAAAAALTDLRLRAGDMAKTEALRKAIPAKRTAMKYNGAAKFGGFRLVQDRTSDPPVLAFPRSITATVDDVSDVASLTDPCPHLEAVHMSESLKSTSDPCESAPAAASYLSVDNVDQSDIPVTRVTVSPATHPMASCALASAMQTVWEDESDDTRILADVSTRSSTPGSVTT